MARRRNTLKLAFLTTALNLLVRQAIKVSVTATAASCDYGLPVMHPAGDWTRAQRGRRYQAA